MTNRRTARHAGKGGKGNKGKGKGQGKDWKKRQHQDDNQSSSAWEEAESVAPGVVQFRPVLDRATSSGRQRAGADQALGTARGLVRRP